MQSNEFAHMIGTIVNTCTIIIGTIVGAVMHRGIKDEYKETLYNVLGLVCLAIGLNATITHLGKSEYPVLFIISITLGSMIGNALDLDGRFARLLNKWSKNNTNTNLAGGLSTATLLYCIGPLAMLGPIVSALKGDHTFLYTNATLDLVTSTIFASTYGIWMILAAPILFCWQGIFYLVAKLSSTAISDALMAELMIVGGLMIVASGLSLLKLKDCKTINMLPSLLIPVMWFIIQSIMKM